MDNITLRLHGALQHAVGRRVVVLPGEQVPLGDLLKSFAAAHGERVAQMIFDRHGEVWRSIILLVNDAPAADGLQTTVHAGDSISLLLPVAGG